MKVRVLVSPKPGVLDPEGRAVQNALSDLGFEGVADTRVGRLIRLDLDLDDAAKAEAQVREMCEKLLANPVIEQYEIAIKDGETD